MRVDVLGVLVQPGCKPDRIAEIQPERLHRQRRDAGKAQEPQAQGRVREAQRQLVRALRIEREQQRPSERVEDSAQSGTCERSRCESLRQPPPTKPSIGAKRDL